MFTASSACDEVLLSAEVKAGSDEVLWSKDLLPMGACHPSGWGDALCEGLGSLDECRLLFWEEAAEEASLSFSNLKLYLNDVINGFKPVRLSSSSSRTLLSR